MLPLWNVGILYVSYIMSLIGVYYESWSEKWTDSASKSGLSRIEKPINIVYLSFAQPDCKYVSGQKSFSGTGLSFSYDWKVLVESIAVLKAKGITVMLSVGGGSYWSGAKPFNDVNCVALMNDLGCDGIDIDWEGHASRDYELTECIKKLKPLMGSKKISFAGFSTGAYGKDGDTYKGSAIDAMTKQGSNVDWINIMAYDAGKKFDPLGAFAAYNVYYKGPLLLGFQVGKQGWGDDLITLDEVEKNCAVVKAQGVKNGIMVWSYQKSNDGLTPTTKEVVSKAAEVFFNDSVPPPVDSKFVFKVPPGAKEFTITFS
jgi:hypothetical protein